MHSLSFSPTNILNKQSRSYPSKRQRGLWRLIESSEPMVKPQVGLDSQPLWYESPDGFLGCIHYVSPVYFANKTPVVVILGPLLHPKVSLNKSQPWLNTILEQGHPVYAISHRSHKTQSENNFRKFDMSFEAMVSGDLLSALDVINHHSGTPNLHLVAQDLGSLLGLQLMSLIDEHRFESVNLFNIPYRFPKNLGSFVLSFMHQNTSIQQVWSKHLHTHSLPDLARKMSLPERSALLLSDSWLAKDWFSTLRKCQSIESLSVLSNIKLLSSLPTNPSCPVHIYTSLNSSNVISNPISEMKHWDLHFHSLPSSIFPLIPFTETLYLT